MYKNNIKAFTFVELIVVITILAILSTIWFWVYQSYLAGGRDTNRLVQLSDIHDGLERYSINSRLPFPEDIVEIQANWDTFAYQGYAGDSVIKVIWYDGGWRDIEYDTYLTYMLATNGRDFQLMTFLNDSQLLSSAVTPTYSNNTHYQGLFPKVTWKPLGIMVDDTTNIPLQELNTISWLGNYDILSWLGWYKIYFSDTDILFTQKDDITNLLPNKNCKRIKDLWKDTWSGVYTINPTWTWSLRVYCDMERDGWWWTYAWFIHRFENGENIYFDREFWWYDVNRTSSGSSYMLNASALNHTEVVFLFEGNDIMNANDTDNLLHFRYQEWLPWMYSGNIMSSTSTNFFWWFGWIEYRWNLDDEWSFTNKRYSGWWGVISLDESQTIIRIRWWSNTRGVYKYTWVWWADPNVGTQRNEAWIYFR